MKKLDYLNKFRRSLNGDMGDSYNGCFVIPRDKNMFQVVASNGAGWEHVSMCLLNNEGNLIERTPKWSEMCELKDLFFELDETVIQYHPNSDNYINEHPYVLHLWRPMALEIPIPPAYLIGNKKK